ncbi:hypothetical protein Q31b_18730 [Novipirellula aureliae]|uniref:Glycosyl transferase family 2 n=1 Tax=Novipirellula aureliae TaxID=2527966 RepID=A0A5C6E8X3_9BACT|nr:hypothetical protein Q31b_18730 [Novipirellula aureliae]
MSSDPKRSFAGVNHACKADVIRSLRLYDEQLGLRGDDTIAGNDDDLYRKALTAGFRVHYRPAAYVNHLIAEHRLVKAPHLKIARVVGKYQAPRFRGSVRDPKYWFGSPRYLYRQMLLSLAQCICYRVAGKPTASFASHLRFERYFAIIKANFPSFLHRR